jgi:hypothetical protein
LSENSIKYDNLFRKFYNLDKTVHIAWAVDVHDDLRYKLTNIIYTPPEISEKEKKLKNDLKDLQEKCTKLQKHLFYRKCDNIRVYTRAVKVFPDILFQVLFLNQLLSMSTKSQTKEISAKNDLKTSNITTPLYIFIAVIIVIASSHTYPAEPG